MAFKLFRVIKKKLAKGFSKLTGGAQQRSVEDMAKDKAFLNQLFRQRGAFEYWLTRIENNPEALHRILSRPEVIRQLSAQTEFMKLLGSESFISAFFETLPERTKASALRKIFKSPLAMLDAIGDDQVIIPTAIKLYSSAGQSKQGGNKEILSAYFNTVISLLDNNAEELVAHIIAHHPQLFKKAIAKDSARDLAIAALVEDPKSTTEIFSLYVQNGNLGASPEQRVLTLLTAILASPPLLQVFRRNKELRADVVKLLVGSFSNLGGDVIDDFGGPILDEVIKYPGAALALDKEDGEGDVAGSLNEGRELAKAVHAIEPYLRKHVARQGREAMRYAKQASLKSYIAAITPENGLSTVRGRFAIADARGFATIVDEILVNEEYYCDIGPAPYIIDAGANIGLATFYLKHQFPDAKIVALEPVPALYNIFARNIKNCDLTDVDLRQVAISLDSGDAEMFYDNTNSLAASLTERRVGKSNDIGKLKVETIRLTDLMDRPVDLLKLDIEGSEYDVIVGLGERVKEIHYLFCEFHADDDLGRERMAKLLLFLSEMGFSYHIARTSWAEKRFQFRPLQYAHRGTSYGLYAVNLAWPES